MQHSSLPSGTVQAHCIRLSPGEDLVPALQDAAKKAIASTHAAGSAFVLSAVGSLSAVTLRLASASRSDTSESNETRQWSERFEVVSLVGTFTPTGEKHLHMSVANAQGNTFGGHLMAGTVFTTLELILGTISDVKFTRELDDKTGYSELVVRAGPAGGSIIRQQGPQVEK
jgi:predicted DNA-binding protein with PD1-like motif